MRMVEPGKRDNFGTLIEAFNSVYAVSLSKLTIGPSDAEACQITQSTSVNHRDKKNQ